MQRDTPRMLVLGGSVAKSLAAMRGATGLGISPAVALERTPGQVIRTDPAWTLAPEVMASATQRATPRQILGVPRVQTAAAVAKNLGLPYALERRLSGIVRDAAQGAANEIVFRKDVAAQLRSQGDVDADLRREVFYRAMSFWRTAADDGRVPFNRSSYLGKAMGTALGKAVGTAPVGTETAADRALAELKATSAHKLTQRGRADPIQQVNEAKQAVPAGSVRIHFSRSRGGYVQAEKQGDGTWKILGKIGKKHEPAAGADGAPVHPELPQSQEHAASPPPGREPVINKPPKALPMIFGKAVGKHDEETTMRQDELFKAIRGFQVPDMVKGDDLGAGDAPTVPEEALSPDDDEVAAQLKASGLKTTLGTGEGGSGELESVTKSAGGGHSTAGGERSTTTTPRADPAANYPVALARGQGQVWTQGPDARVVYSSISDEVIAKAMENGSLTPEFGAPMSSPLYQLNRCGCGSAFSKAITVCPDCGTDKSSSPRVQGGLAKSVTASLFPDTTPDLYFA